MSTTRETIMQTLTQAGITNMSVEDVIAEFQASDELSGYLAGADDVEQTVLAHLPTYIAMRGLSTDLEVGQETDPTATQEPSTNPSAMPASVTSATTAAVIQEINKDLDAKRARSEQSEMVAVLIDKPYPGEWMVGIGNLHVKGELQKYVDTMKSRYHPDESINTLIGHRDSWFIPTNQQMSELKVLHQNEHKDSKTTPAWFDFDNENAYNDIMNTLTSGDGTFGVLIAPREDEGEGAYLNKAWRWNTKGFVVRIPSTEAGASSFEERFVTKKVLQAILATETAGYISSRTDHGLGCRLVFTKKKAQAGASATATAKEPGLRVEGNTAANKELDLRCINKIGNGQGKMTVRSSAFYFAARVSKVGTWSVKKMRVPLLWEQAPVFVRLPEYEQAFPNKLAHGISAPTAKDLQEMQDVACAYVLKQMSSGAGRFEAGLTTFCQAVEENVNKAAAEAAQSIAM